MVKKKNEIIIVAFFRKKKRKKRRRNNLGENVGFCDCHRLNGSTSNLHNSLTFIRKNYICMLLRFELEITG